MKLYKVNMTDEYGPAGTVYIAQDLKSMSTILKFIKRAVGNPYSLGKPIEISVKEFMDSDKPGLGLYWTLDTDGVSAFYADQNFKTAKDAIKLSKLGNITKFRKFFKD